MKCPECQIIGAKSSIRIEHVKLTVPEKYYDEEGSVINPSPTKRCVLKCSNMHVFHARTEMNGTFIKYITVDEYASRYD
jgi:hypothetical protein